LVRTSVFCNFDYTKKIIGIMVSSEEEQAGLDRTSHSESAYN